MILLFTDTHLEDNPDNEYRWTVFDRVEEVLDSHPVSAVFNLGDMWDRKDRFSGLFVNRLVDKLGGIGRRVPFFVLRGNHDRPLNGPAFFEFVNGLLPGVTYVTQPERWKDVLLLPFTPDPSRDWLGLPFGTAKAAFMHVTVTGAIAENGRELVGQKLPLLPQKLRLYSGDVHNPQTIRNLTYVGCPHPIKFGDEFPCRMLLLDEETFEVVEEVRLDPPRKTVVEVSSLEDLGAIEVRAGDQVRIRFALEAGSVEEWGSFEARLEEWASKRGVRVSSIEGVVEGRTSTREVDPGTAPEEVLRDFAKEEGISEELLATGLALLQE